MLASYKVCLQLLCRKSLYCTVWLLILCGSWILLSYLYMIIYEVLYTWCLRYNICSTWFLDTVWRETLEPWKFGEIDDWPKIHKISPFKFYTSIVKSRVSVILPPLLKNIKQIEDIFVGMCPVTCRIPLIILIPTACRLCAVNFPYLVH